MSDPPAPVPDETPVHRLGGGTVGNLALKPAEASLDPPGISTLLGGTASEAAEAMRKQFPRMAPRGQTVVGSTTAGQIREAGFDVIMNPTRRFPQHGRLVHQAGAAEFTPENLRRLADRFQNQSGL